MKAPRLCMVVHGPYPVGEPRVAREVRAAIADGWEVDVVAMRRGDEPATEVVDGARVYRLPLSRRRGGGTAGVVLEYVGFTALATLRVATLAVRRRYDVVQVHNPPDFLAAAALFPKLLGSRVVFDVHDLASDMFAMRFDDRGWAERAEPVLRVIERAAAGVADAVVTVHEPYRRELVSRGVPAAKVTVVMNSIDERLLPEPSPGSRPGFDVVYHGTVTPPYGVELLVEAAARVADEVPDIRLSILGEGDAVEAVRRRATELGIDDRVEVSGTYLPHRDVLAAVRGASVGVIPNLPIRLNRYALSSKLFEYVALRIPVVCAGLPTLREHFADDELRFFEAGDLDGLVEALVDVARDPDGAQRRVDAALHRYEEYRWPVNAARYVAVLRDGAPPAIAGG